MINKTKIIQGIQNVYRDQTERFFRTRLRDNEEEYADLEEKIHELIDRQEILQRSIDFCKARLNITD